MGTTEAADGTRIHFRQIGRSDAEPLLMIQGLGTDSRGWVMQTLAFGSRFHCVAPDNRGVGRSDKPAGPYRLEQMADDAIAVLDELGIESAHVMGASMGGVIAQMIAVLHPERVRSLVLSCTACSHHDWRRELFDEWATMALSQGMRPFITRNLRWLMGNRSLRRLQPVYHFVGPIAVTVPVHSFAAQVYALLDQDDSIKLRLGEIDVPTLIVVGSQDVLTPVGDSEEIAARIRGSRLAVIRGAAHGVMFENFRLFNQTVLSFYDTLPAEILAPRAEVIDLTLPAPLEAVVDLTG
ncbi:MAG: alpha/beta fold hydrolase [Actinobacteria bacterium]|nr:MAG: alpha/beta fold hydrolase [Actinomycetota bacterium]RIK04722.1 MAG: hypothetical protein DCC48_11750 [Acidobacteriota bacterium]